MKKIATICTLVLSLNACGNKEKKDTNDNDISKNIIKDEITEVKKETQAPSSEAKTNKESTEKAKVIESPLLDNTSMPTSEEKEEIIVENDAEITSPENTTLEPKEKLVKDYELYKNCEKGSYFTQAIMRDYNFENCHDLISGLREMKDLKISQQNSVLNSLEEFDNLESLTLSIYAPFGPKYYFINLPSSLKKLDLDGIEIHEDILKQLPNLEHLSRDKSGYRLEECFSQGKKVSLANVSKLKSLTIDGCVNDIAYDELPDSVISLKISSWDHLTSINDFDFAEINANPQLEELILARDMTLSGIHKIKNLTNLKTLKIEQKLEDIEGIQNFKNLTELQIKGAKFQNNVSELKDLTKLTKLELSQSKLFNLRFLDKLKNLEILILNNNQIEFSTGLKNLPKLKHLNLGENKLKFLDSMEGLLSLESLYLYDNELENVQGLFPLTNLKKLLLHSNDLKDLNGIEGLVNLEIINASYNEIESVSGLSFHKNLKTVYLQSNQIEDLDDLGNITSLENLSLDWNPIKGIAPLRKLSKLKYLHLPKTDTIISASALVDMKDLSFLSMGRFDIAMDYSALAGLENLERLFLSGSKRSLCPTNSKSEILNKTCLNMLQ